MLARQGMSGTLGGAALLSPLLYGAWAGMNVSMVFMRKAGGAGARSIQGVQAHPGGRDSLRRPRPARVEQGSAVPDEHNNHLPAEQ